MAKPVRDAKGSEFGEIAVVENENEMARGVAKALDHVGVASRKIPDLTGVKIVGF